MEKEIELVLFERGKGYSSELFDNEEWREYEAFKCGFNLGLVSKK
jgi:hypothetical protein